MAENTIHIGIIGTGRVAQAHLEAVRDSREDVVLAAVCDVDSGKARKAAETYGAGKSYQDYRQVAGDPRVDAAIICLPNHLHHAAVLALAEAGKNILVEKPMSVTLREADTMIRSAEQNGVILMVGQSRRFSRAIGLVRKRLPELGAVFRIDISFLVLFPSPQTDWWSDPKKAGPLVIPLQGSHSLDTIVWLLDKLPSTVYAHTKLKNPQFGSADEANLVLGFQSGKIASVQLSLNTAPYVHETLISGERGTLRIYEHPTAKTYGFRNRVVLNDETIFDEEEIPSLYANQLSEFVAAIREKREPLASGKDVRRTMQVLEAACRSSRTGKAVRL
jgi:UDP-N-acetylglucosamine 3-dehydrogenase